MTEEHAQRCRELIAEIFVISFEIESSTPSLGAKCEEIRMAAEDIRWRVDGEFVGNPIGEIT